MLSQFFTLGQTLNGSNYYYTRDHLNSIRELDDSSGTAQATYNYDLYGQTIKLSGSLASDFQYAGYYQHASSGLHVTSNRLMNSSIARWINRDPIAENGGINLYAYVRNNPANNTDPSGLATFISPIQPPGNVQPPSGPVPSEPGGGAAGGGGAPPPPDGGGGYAPVKFDWGTLKTPEMNRLWWFILCFWRASVLSKYYGDTVYHLDKMPPEQAAAGYGFLFSYYYWQCLKKIPPYNWRCPPKLPNNDPPESTPPALGGSEPPMLPP